MTDQSNSAPARAALPVIEPTYTIEQVAQMAEENTAIIQNTAANVSEVVDAAERLNAAVSHFKV